MVISPHQVSGTSIINSRLMAGSSVRGGIISFLSPIFNPIESGVSMFYGVISKYRSLLKYLDRLRKAFTNFRTAASAGGMDREIGKETRNTPHQYTI